jgi:hypothetical protein
VINGYVAGIEEEQEEEFDPTQDSGTQRYKYEHLTVTIDWRPSLATNRCRNGW